jgi:hypothetical protein
MSLTSFNEESLIEITKNIDCVQETEQHSVVIEHNWSIDGILDLINIKRPGEKIESEQFNYQTSVLSGSTSAQLKNKSCSTVLVEEYSECPVEKDLIDQKCRPTNPEVSIFKETIYDFFIKSSVWRLEINKSPNDHNKHISVSVLLLHKHASQQLEASDYRLLLSICQQMEAISNSGGSAALKLKLKFCLLDETLNELFAKKTIEARINLNKFFRSLLISTKHGLSLEKRVGSCKLVEKFSIENFCKTKELLCWLNRFKSDDFCLLTEFRLYGQTRSHDSSSFFMNDTKMRLTTRLNNFKRAEDQTSFDRNCKYFFSYLIRCLLSSYRMK